MSVKADKSVLDLMRHHQSRDCHNNYQWGSNARISASHVGQPTTVNIIAVMNIRLLFENERSSRHAVCNNIDVGCGMQKNNVEGTNATLLAAATRTRLRNQVKASTLRQLHCDVSGCTSYC